jgi:RND family efflux transporter MFP subunit
MIRKVLPGCRSFLLLGSLLASLPLGCAKAPKAEEEPPPAPVQAVAAKRVELAEWTEFPGTTQPLPKHAAKITAAVEARVLTVLPHGASGPAVAEGQRVMPGQVIVQLDDRIVQAKRASLIASQKDLEAQVKQAQTLRDGAQIVVDSSKLLERPGPGESDRPLISKVDVDKARNALDEKQAGLEAAQAKLAAGAQELKALDAQLNYYTLHAPIAGYLGTIQVVVGQTLPVGTLVAEIVDLDELDVLCLVPPSQIGRLALNQPAQIVGAEGDAEAGPEGKVVYIAVQAQAETGSFPVKIRFANPNLRRRANILVRARIRTRPSEQRLVIPEAALMEDQEPPAVMVVEDVESKKNEKGEEEKIGKARKLLATVGVRDRVNHRVEILELKAPSDSEKEHGEEVKEHGEEAKEKTVAPDKALFVIAGGHGLRDGDPVKVEEAKAED